MLKSISDASLFRLFDSALDAVVGMDRGGHVIAWNAQAEKLFRWTKAEAMGQVLGDLIVPDHLRAAHAEGLRRYLETGEGPVLNRRIEVEAVDRRGVTFPIELTVVPVNETGEERFFAFLRDISAQRSHEERLRQRAMQAEVLWEATELVAAGGTLDDLLAACLEKISRITGWPVGHVCLPDELQQPRKLLSGAVWHFERDDLRPIAEETARFEFERGVGLPGRIWASGQPEWIPDIAEVANLPRKSILLRHGLHAVFGLPVHWQGRLQAVLEFFSPARQAPDEHLLLVIRSLGQQLGRVLERQRAQEQQELLLHELSHRIGNTLAVLRSVFAMSASHAQSLDELRIAFESRLTNMAEAHRLLAASNWRSAELEEIVRSAIAPYCHPTFRNCRLSGDPVRLPAASVLPLTMVFHELATNAGKYGAFSSESGAVSVSWQVRETTNGAWLALIWREENGHPMPADPGSGYGTKLIDTSVKRSLGGTIERTFADHGLRVNIAIPLG